MSSNEVMPQVRFYAETSDGDVVPIIFSNGAFDVETQATSTNAYGPHVQMLGDAFAGVEGVNDDDVVYTSPDIIYINNIYITCTAGVVDIDVSYDDGVTWRNILFTSVVNTTNVATADDVELASGEHTILTKADLGTITNFRINQKGATASNATGRYGVA